MTHEITFSEAMLSKKYTVAKKGGDRQLPYFCNVPVSYEETIEDVAANKVKKIMHYKSIFGCDENDVGIKRTKFILQKIKEQQEGIVSKDLFITKIEDWLYNYMFHKVKATSFDRLEQTYNNIKEALSKNNMDAIKLVDIKREHINLLMNYELNKGYSYSTLKKIYNFFTAIFSYYSDEITKNPMAKIIPFSVEFVIQTQEQLKKEKTVALFKKEQNMPLTSTEEYLTSSRLKFKSKESSDDIHIFTDEEIEKIKEAVNMKYKNGKSVIKQGKYFLFILNAGLRCGESDALKYSDFDFTNNTVWVNKNMVTVKERDTNGKATGRRISKLSTTKTTSSKSLLYLSPTAMQYIKELKEEEPEGYEGYVIHGRGDFENQAIENRALAKRFYTLLDLAGVERRGLHSLRHTYATKMYEATEGDNKFVSEQLRHKSATFTQDTYTHVLEKYKKQVINKFEI